MVSLSITSQLPVPSVSNLLTMVKFGKQPIIEDPIQIADPTAWMIENLVADFLLMPGAVVYMCMFGYTFLHGCKVFKALPSESSIAYKFVSLLFACTGGGIIVPIFLNGVPVPLANDAYHCCYGFFCFASLLSYFEGSCSHVENCQGERLECDLTIHLHSSQFIDYLLFRTLN